MARPIAEFVVSIKDGRISKRSASRIMTKYDKAEGDLQSQPPPDKLNSNGKLIVAEEVEEGHISWPARMSFHWAWRVIAELCRS